MDDIRELMSERANGTLNDARGSYEEQVDVVLGEIMATVLDSRRPGLGSANRTFAQEFKAKWEKAFGKEGAKIIAMSEKDFAAKWAKVKQAVGSSKKIKLKAPGKHPLEKFSPWLKAYTGAGGGTAIELPGQYDGMSKPRPETHVVMVACDPDVLVLGSIRRPKRLKIMGNDERAHSYLVKGGEDLRLDQRVEQLFRVMNRIFAEDGACSARGFGLRTYEVVPMTSKVGILEWVDGTKPLKAIVEDQRKADAVAAGHKNITGIRQTPAGNRYSAFQTDTRWGGKANNVVDLYKHCMLKATRQEVIANYRACVAELPWDYMRRGVLSMASSSEAFIAVRANFTATLAVYSIANYIVGIGDRVRAMLVVYLLGVVGACLCV